MGQEGAVHVRLLVADGEPLEQELRALVEGALREAGVDDADVEVVRVRGDEEARAARCLGSPTVRIDGYDVEYAEREPPETTAGPRYYSTPDGWRRLPEHGMVLFAIREAQARGGGETA